MRPMSGRFPAVAITVLSTLSAANAGVGFDVVVLGARGGIEDGNLSAFMVAPAGDNRAVTCDAGSLVNGLRVADAKGAFDAVEVPADSPYTRIGYVLTETIKGYLVSHAHMDHVAGIVIASPDDSKKPIYGLPSVTAAIQDTYFNWQAWPNFAFGGKAPQLKKYALTDLTPGEQRMLDGTAMEVTAFPLSHGGTESTAFLIESGDDALLCFGDTGPDEVEKSTRMRDLWAAVAKRAKAGHLKAIIIEVSYTNAQPDEYLFGHLTPEWLQKSLAELEALAGAGSLKDLPIIVSHVKYSLKKGMQPTEAILGELEAGNTLGVRYIMPEQGMSFRF
ncbi:3',5'-cyclic-nucleotide phosphodiesterase [Mesorhizobium sp. VNQ89]|uniref:3',5'-cyclic-nucleotide phosphodiesterase n=1 Tax=Mesorhizobium quangtriensis TaxID=3157709 RepID=UPI0032B8757E